MASLRAGDNIRVLDEDGTTALVAYVSRLDETTTVEDGPLDWSYDITPVGARVLPDSADALPHLPEVLITPWEGDARQLAAGDAAHRYGWTKDGGRFG